MRVKEGVALAGLNWRMRRVLRVADHVWQTYGHELVITSTTDGEHSRWSWHPFGMAVDLRTRDMGLAEVTMVAQDLQHILGRPYQVVIEATHIHVECDLDANPDFAGKHPG